MAKKFISFLGITNYVRCNYTVPDTRPQRITKGVRFVQEAIIDLHCKEWTSEDDRFLVFVTDEARAKNWEDSCHLDREGVPLKDEENKEGGLVLEGLKTRLKRLGVLERTELIHIPEGFSKEDVWQIFNTVFEQIEEKDELLLDITNAFRFIPMLGMVLINYAKVVKNSSVLGIYYGAFEKLGPAWKVKSMLSSERDAPIVEITSLAYLQDWTIAASDFVQYGNAQRIAKLTQENIKDTLRISKGKNVVARQLNGFANQLLTMTQSISTVRGKAIIEGKMFEDVSKTIDNFEQSDFIVPLFPLLEQVQQKAKIFGRNQIANGFKAVQWCFDNELTQQGITLLQEMLVTHICSYFHAAFGLNFAHKKDRNLIGACFAIQSQKIAEDKWTVEADDKPLVKRLLKDPIIQDFKKVYDQLNQLRNDINHGGFVGQTKPLDFRKKLGDYFESIQQLLENHPIGTTKPALQPLFLNLSNHPSGLWKKHQKAAALQWGEIVDVPFPNIPPEWTNEEVETLVEEYVEKCLALEEAKNGAIAAIHLMGEMTFTFKLLQRLKEMDITVLASTTERLSSQDEKGNKVTVFNFIQFRKY